MAATPTYPSRLNDLIEQLDGAVAISDCGARCSAVKQILHDVTAGGEDFIPDKFLKPAKGIYARRLVHKDPAGRYTVLAMVWDAGQGTALHDHDGHWCVECVYRGRIKVVSYSLQSDPAVEPVRFAPEREVYASIADAGALIPPFDYHTLENAETQPAVTIHVYAGELTQCAIFVPDGEGYRREVKTLGYTKDD